MFGKSRNETLTLSGKGPYVPSARTLRKGSIGAGEKTSEREREDYRPMLSCSKPQLLLVQALLDL